MSAAIFEETHVLFFRETFVRGKTVHFESIGFLIQGT